MIILYRNGLTEELKPAHFTFTDTELLNLLIEFPLVRTHRLSEIPNTWVMWGEHVPVEKEEDEYNELGSAVLSEDIYSPIFVIHDTEINHDWNLTDNIIQFNYDFFKKEVFNFFDTAAYLIMTDKEEQRKESGQQNNMLILEQDGVTEMKQIIYNFDLTKQTESFFQYNNFHEFSIKVHEFLKKFYANGHTFLIYADKNVLIKVEDKQVKPLIDKIIDTFQAKEQYELCSDVKIIYDKWFKFKNKKKPVSKKINKPSNKSKGLTKE